MSNTTPETTNVLIDTIAEALRERLAPAPAGDNPLAGLDLAALRGGRGVATARDQHPATNIAAQGPLGYAMEASRKAGLQAGRVDTGKVRHAQARERAARKANFDDLGTGAAPDPARLAGAWAVVVPLGAIIAQVCQIKRQWAERHLGTLVEDFPSMVTEQMVLAIARSDRDLDVLVTAAQELAGERERTGSVPGEQRDARRERKALVVARKWLMGLINNRVLDTLRSAYTEARNLRWENIDKLDTIMASVSGMGGDPAMTAHKASAPPAFQGVRFTAPGGIDPRLLAVAINAAITAHGCDLLAETLLAQDNRRTDGAIKWTECAEAIFLAGPEGGAWMWQAVCSATAHLAGRSRSEAIARAARTYARRCFAWLPELIVALVGDGDGGAFGLHTVAHDGARAHLASDFECFLDDAPVRFEVKPRLGHASVADAARALAEGLSLLVTGTDVLDALAQA